MHPHFDRITGFDEIASNVEAAQKSINAVHTVRNVLLEFDPDQFTREELRTIRDHLVNVVREEVCE